MKKLKTLKVKAFTLVEMLVVLLIISVLMLLFVPNLTKQKDAVSDTGNAAVVKVVESQAELYELKNVNEKATLGKLVADGRITDKQVASYKAYYGTAVKLVQLRIKAFTLLESLLALFVVSFILLGLSGSVQAGFNQVQEQLFFMEFEHLYQESQKLSVAGHEKIKLTISERKISNGYQQVEFPKALQEHAPQTIQFDQAGGNSSLSKIVFQTEDKKVVYQLYMGNGKFKKTTNEG